MPLCICKKSSRTNFFVRWIVHGDNDSVVYIRSTHKLMDLVQQMQPEVTFRLDIAPGEDHAFDHLKEDWESLIQPGGYDFVRDAWLGPTVPASG